MLLNWPIHGFSINLNAHHVNGMTHLIWSNLVHYMYGY